MRGRWVECGLGLLGALVNVVAFGFRTHNVTNNAFELALVNWLRDPTLYPNDPLTQVYATYPSAFWPAVARASRHLATEQILFIAFLLTKVLFFLALARLVASAVRRRMLVAAIVLVVALSPTLNSATELGSSDILNDFQTHTSLAIALLLWVTVLLVERRWLTASVLAAVTIRINMLFVGFLAPGILVLAWHDRRLHGRRILLAGLIGALISLPWLLSLRGAATAPPPPGFVDALLSQYPDMFTLRTHTLASLARGFGTLAAGGGAIALAKRLALPRLPRLEALAAACLIPLGIGIVVGLVLPLPSLIRAQLMRADTFAILFAVLLVQIYGAELLERLPEGTPAAAALLGMAALLLPLSAGFAVFGILVVGAMLLLDPEHRFDRLCRGAIGRGPTGVALAAVVAAMAFAAPWLLGRRPTPGMIAVLAAVLAALLAVQRRSTLTLLGATLLAAIIVTVPRPSMLWHPIMPLDARAMAWREVQQWAREHTPRQAKFMVPPASAGFRVYSERSSWVDWNDGITIDALPSYADEWRRRMTALGVHLVPLRYDLDEIADSYRAQPWERLRDLARAEQVDYVIQSSAVGYPPTPVFANRDFAVYRVIKQP